MTGELAATEYNHCGKRTRAQGLCLLKLSSACHRFHNPEQTGRSDVYRGFAARWAMRNPITLVGLNQQLEAAAGITPLQGVAARVSVGSDGCRSKPGQGHGCLVCTGLCSPKFVFFKVQLIYDTCCARLCCFYPLLCNSDL